MSSSIDPAARGASLTAPGAPPGPPGAAPAPAPDLAGQAGDFLDRIVVTVRDRATRPVVVGVRGVVFGVLAAFAGVAALVLVYILLIRVLSYLPGGVWVAHLIMGVVFTVSGAVLMAKRKTPLVDEAMR